MDRLTITGKKPLLLIIDDQPDNLYVTQTIIEELIPDIDVITATDPVRGLENARIQRPDGVISDLKMPILDGIQLCKEIKSSPFTSVIPVILITSQDTDAALRSDALDAGAYDFISRPIDNIEMAARVKAMLRSKETEDKLRMVNDNLEQLVIEKSGELAEREKLFRQLTESINEVFWIATADRKEILYVSPAYETIWGKSRESLHNRPNSWQDSILEEDKTSIEDLARIPSGDGGEKNCAEYRIFRPDGSMRWIKSQVFPVFDRNGKVERVAGIAEDITSQKNYEEKLEAALIEKDMLIKEIHHRVKNNMTVISSLLRLQSNAFEDPDVVQAFEESHQRIRSMALVHEKLYRASNLSQMDFSQYIPDLVKRISQANLTDNNKIEVQIDASSDPIGIDTAIPCGLIISELVTNSFKYAFPGLMEGTISVRFSHNRDDNYLLIVKDSGIGIPENVSFDSLHSFGLYLVRLLVQQLGGTFTVDREGGTTFTITFPRKKKR